jgi:formate dehydrogenase major subunit
MHAMTREEQDDRGRSPDISFELDGRPVQAVTGETLLQVARREGIEVPHLCWKEGLAPAGNCRACVVEVQGERTLAASCCRLPTPGLVVETTSPRARAAQKLVIELLQSDMAEAPYALGNEVDQWAVRLDLGRPRFAPSPAPPGDTSHPAIAVNLDACILCTRCLRACREGPGRSHR